MPPSLKRRLEHWLLLNLAIPLAWLVCRLIGRTLRHDRAGRRDEIMNAIRTGRRYVIAFWHGDSFLMAREMQDGFPFGDIHIMTSQSRDGALMARFLRLSGVRVARGSSSRGGARALLEMIRAMAPRDFAALAVDAPRGPRHCVNRDGILLLAQRSGLPILPMAGNADTKWVARSWDRMEFPKPFARTTMRYGEPLEVPRGATADDFTALRAELERRLRELKGEGHPSTTGSKP